MDLCYFTRQDFNEPRGYLFRNGIRAIQPGVKFEACTDEEEEIYKRINIKYNPFSIFFLFPFLRFCLFVLFVFLFCLGLLGPLCPLCVLCLLEDLPPAGSAAWLDTRLAVLRVFIHSVRPHNLSASDLLCIGATMTRIAGNTRNKWRTHRVLGMRLRTAAEARMRVGIRIV